MVVAVLSVVGSVGASPVALFVDPLPADVGPSPLLPLPLAGAPEPAGSPGGARGAGVARGSRRDRSRPVAARPLAVRSRWRSRWRARCRAVARVAGGTAPPDGAWLGGGVGSGFGWLGAASDRRRSARPVALVVLLVARRGLSLWLPWPAGRRALGLDLLALRLLLVLAVELRLLDRGSGRDRGRRALSGRAGPGRPAAVALPRCGTPWHGAVGRKRRPWNGLPVRNGSDEGLQRRR